MRLKQISKRRWKTRLMKGLWIPCMVIEDYSLTAPEGMKLVWHHTEDFLMLVPGDLQEYRPYHPDDTKRAWE
ncbi:MAG: hypothetical protein AMJ59_12800 [Gammaproteobacteria bacterium SG8_31]|nr:MAG: hypothetical protein AMJ59_12800 [Gammaproteobacteria bacterium SG8_31]